MEKMMERFLKYISIDTKSDEDNENCPSSTGQLDLGNILVSELKDIGIEDAHIDKNGYVYGSLKGNVTGVPTIGVYKSYAGV